MHKIISPIAIDMGAKNTGVYYANYKQGATFKEIDKQGQVLVYDKYTPLLKDRTANRHVRRGYQRKKLAKRLLTVILKKHFEFSADEHSQAIGFLLNRRGFSFLEEEYSKEHLNNLPDGAWEILSDEVKDIFDGKENIANQLIELAIECPEKITSIFDGIQKIEKNVSFQDTKSAINNEFVCIDFIEKISKACALSLSDKNITDDAVIKDKKDKQKLSQTSNWIITKLNKDFELELETDSSYQTNLTKQITLSNAEKIKGKLSNFDSDIKLVKEREIVKNKETENNKSIWNFNHSKFEFNTKNEKGLEENTPKVHLHHFCYAIYKINHELISGNRHRSKYFDEITSDLENLQSHSHQYLSSFAQAINSNEKLDMDKLGKLVCHISNFELKPLRAYFNDKTPINKKDKNFESHKKADGGDKFNNEKLSRLASTWFLKNWRVNAEKDNQNKVDSYGELKEVWKSHVDKNDIVDFWLKTDPKLTIPPYQSMNNRKPPKCQTLLLNGDYLNVHYPEWKNWLKLLQPNEKYKEKLQGLQRGKGKTENHDGRLINDDLIALRQLQFILDTAKKLDKYKLNEIWSIYHQWQKPNVEDKDKLQEKLDKTKQASKLPDKLKKDLSFNKQDSFGHFINKYYQTRRKAKGERYFLHQSKKDKWITDSKLLAVCTHKPKQKQHQWHIDLAAVFGVDGEELENEIGEQIPNEYFKEIKGFQDACQKSAKAQKDHRGELKIKISKALARESMGEKFGKDDNKDLSTLAKRCYELRAKLIKKIDIDGLLADKQAKENDQKIALVFKFAQINNIVFKERTGFSKTCPVCSTDNGSRMQESDNGIARASRLPAMSVRLIDGVVMRICDAISRQVANTKWDEIKTNLEQGKKITIPLIMEQNRFEFEPSLAKIKGNKVTITKDKQDKSRKIEINTRKGKVELIDDGWSQQNKKEQRTKDMACGVCAYTGDNLGADGEIDHIIPQASRYGTLNDEANLIYVSSLGNQDKGKQSKFLSDLNSAYKNKIFENKPDNDIIQFIYQQLEGIDAVVGEATEDDNFDFGRYLSFINLDENQQKAFRHALFLPDDDPLKQKVTRALQNRNRTIVNGTQRYLAQCIADKLYKYVQKTGKEKQIKFDYFEYSARADIPNSTYNLRKFYGIGKPKIQPLHSHLIDAQMAFLLATDDHKNDGVMGLKFGKLETIKQGDVDRKTGEFSPTKFFDLSVVPENEFTEVNLEPKTSNQKIAEIEKKHGNKKQNLSKIFNRYVFKQNAIGEKYLPIVEFNNKLYLGYPQTQKGGVYSVDEYCTEIIKKSELDNFKSIIKQQKYYQLTTDNKQIKIWTIKTVNKKYKQIDKDSHKYFSKLSQQYSDNDKQDIKHIKLILKKCKKYIQKVEVINAPSVLGKETNKKYPLYKMWEEFDKKWQGVAGDNYRTKDGAYLIEADTNKKWIEFCKKQLPAPKNQAKNQHAKVRKFTMNAIANVSGTVFRMNRHGEDIYQAVPLDTNIVSKDNSNFLIKHSNNLTLVNETADIDLNKAISTKVAEKLKNCEVDTTKFFDFKDNPLSDRDAAKVKVFLNHTSVDIKNFPLDKFKEYYNEYDKDKKSILILTETKAEKQLKAKEDLIYAQKNKVDSSIRITVRDASISNIEVNSDTVNFSLPFKSSAIRNFYNELDND